MATCPSALSPNISLLIRVCFPTADPSAKSLGRATQIISSVFRLREQSWSYRQSTELCSNRTWASIFKGTTTACPWRQRCTLQMGCLWILAIIGWGLYMIWSFKSFVLPIREYTTLQTLTLHHQMYRNPLKAIPWSPTPHSINSGSAKTCLFLLFRTEAARLMQLN